MIFEEIVDQAIAIVRRRGRVTYRMLKVQFGLDDDLLEVLKDELIYGQRLARDEEERVLVWAGNTESTSSPASGATSAPATGHKPSLISYTPLYLTEKILTSRSALAGERKQVTVLFADIKDSTELIRDLDPEEAQKLLDPAIYLMMEAVHRFERTVNQVLGDGIMSILGAPIAHEDHALRACYAALAMQAVVRDYTEEALRVHGIPLQIRVGLNSGKVVVRTIGNDLHMDYSAVGQSTHLAARMEQLAHPGSILLTAATLRFSVHFRNLGVYDQAIAAAQRALTLAKAGETRCYRHSRTLSWALPIGLRGTISGPSFFWILVEYTTSRENARSCSRHESISGSLLVQ